MHIKKAIAKLGWKINDNADAWDETVLKHPRHMIGEVVLVAKFGEDANSWELFAFPIACIAFGPSDDDILMVPHVIIEDRPHEIVVITSEEIDVDHWKHIDFEDFYWMVAFKRTAKSRLYLPLPQLSFIAPAGNDEIDAAQYTLLPGVFLNGAACSKTEMRDNRDMTDQKDDMKKKDDKYWRDKLDEEQFNVCRLGGTEAPFSGDLYNNHDPGMYMCVACGSELFSSGDKFESGTGWPSFSEAANKKNVGFEFDDSHGMRRTEVVCNVCGSHLGHVFDDGPTPTGKRYCINSVALKFVPKEK